MSRDTDGDWQEFGRTEPYWAVLTDEKFKVGNLTSESVEEFFRGGEDQVSALFDQLRRHLGRDFVPASALDFGCGVGRLTLPLARRCGHVTGVDVSPAMLEKAGGHAGQLGLTNVTFVKGDDDLSAVAGPFDLVNSYIVLQHIPAERGERLIRRLVGLLRDGGVGALHLTYSKSTHPPEEMHRQPPPPSGVRETFAAFADALKGRSLDALRRARAPAVAPVAEGPVMLMTDYSLNRVFHFLQEAGVRRMAVQFSQHGTVYGALLLFRKEPNEAYLV